MRIRLKGTAVAALAWLCASSFTANAQAATAEKAVVYQASQTLLYLPLYVAIDKGLFTKHGLDVQKVTAGSGAAAVAAVIGGHADFSLQDPMTAVLANLKGADLVNVANVVAGVPVWIVVPGNSTLKTEQDLAGKSVATALVPSTSTYLLQRLIKQANLKDVSLNMVQLGTELAPVSANRSVAAATYEPQVDQSITEGYKILYGFPKAYPGGYAFSTIDTASSTITGKPKLVQAFVDGIAEAEAMIKASPEMAKAVAESEFPNLSKTIVDAATQRMIDQNIYAATPEISQQAFGNALDLQIDVGNIKPGAVSYAKVVDNRFADTKAK